MQSNETVHPSTITGNCLTQSSLLTQFKPSKTRLGVLGAKSLFVLRVDITGKGNCAKSKVQTHLKHNLLTGGAEREGSKGEMLAALLKELPESAMLEGTKAEYFGKRPASANIPPISLPANFKTPFFVVGTAGLTSPSTAKVES